MGAAAIPLLLAGSAAGTISSIQQASFQSKVAKQNAANATATAAAREKRFRRQSRRKIGSLRAAALAGGRTLRGSPLEILADAAATLEEDALFIRAGGEIKRNQFLVESRAAKQRQIGAGFQGIFNFGSILGSSGFGGSSGGGGTSSFGGISGNFNNSNTITPGPLFQ